MATNVIAGNFGPERTDPVGPRGIVLEIHKAKKKPVVRMVAGAIDKVVDIAEATLIYHGTQLYQHGELVRPVRLDEIEGDAVATVQRQRGALIMLPADEYWITEEFCRAGIWFGVGATDKAYRKQWLKDHPDKTADEAPMTAWSFRDPAAKYSRHLLARAGAWSFPVLRAITSCPTIDRNGRIIQTPGYDDESRLLLDFKVGDFPPIPENPSRENAKKALEVFAKPLRSMPFASPEARSVALSLGLTALARPCLRSAPIHGLDAPQPRTGKSLIAHWASIMRTGVVAPVIHQGKEEGEDEKRLSSVLRYGDPLIVIDNCSRPITGDFLCSMATEEVVQARILGKTERVSMPSTSVLVTTGNNLVFEADVAQRAIISRLDAGVEFPGERDFDFDVKEETLRDRGLLVAAGLTILRAFALDKRDQLASKDGLRIDGLSWLKPMGGFEDWSTVVRGALVRLGEADPCASRTALIEADPARQDLADIAGLWETAFGDESVKLDKVKDHDDLCRKFIEVTRSREWSVRSAAYWLRANKDRFIDGKAFRSRTVHGGGQAYWLSGAVPLPPTPGQ